MSIRDILFAWPAQVGALIAAGAAGVVWVHKILEREADAASAASAFPAVRRFPVWLHCILLAACGTSWMLVQSDPSPGDFVQGAFLLVVLYGTAWIDLRTLEVPLAPVFLGIGVRCACVAILDRPQLLATLLGTFTGAGVLALVGLAYEWLRGHPGLGHGDTAVLGLIGAFVGWQGIVPALLSAAIAGLVCGGGALLLARKSLQTPVPFVPFLAAGGWAVFLAQTAGWLPAGGAGG